MLLDEGRKAFCCADAIEHCHDGRTILTCSRTSTALGDIFRDTNRDIVDVKQLHGTLADWYYKGCKVRYWSYRKAVASWFCLERLGLTA